MQNLPTDLIPPPHMTILALSDDNRVNRSDTLMLNEFLAASPIAAVLDESDRIYRSRITQYIQLLSTGEIEDNRLIMVPASNNVTLRRVATSREEIVLKVFYTTFTQ